MMKLYTIEHCGRCGILKNLIKDRNDVEVVDITNNSSASQFFIDKGFLSMPVLQDGENYYGFEDALALLRS